MPRSPSMCSERKPAPPLRPPPAAIIEKRCTLLPTAPSRRRQLQATGAAALLPLSGLQASARTAPDQRATYLFFNPAEARFIEAAVARLIPDEPGLPGALAPGLPAHIDGPLGGGWGHG